jgi:hypothetical protein
MMNEPAPDFLPVINSLNLRPPKAQRNARLAPLATLVVRTFMPGRASSPMPWIPFHLHPGARRARPRGGSPCAAARRNSHAAHFARLVKQKPRASQAIVTGAEPQLHGYDAHSRGINWSTTSAGRIGLWLSADRSNCGIETHSSVN